MNKFYILCKIYLTGKVDTTLWGVVGREPAIECVVDAFKDCIVPIWKNKISNNLATHNNS